MDIEIWANAKLQGDWSAPAVVSQIDATKLELLSSVFSKGKLDHLVKVRLLVACMLLPAQRKAQLSAELRELREAACADEDEWVRVMGCAVGDFSGRLDLDAVTAANQMVGDTMATILHHLDDAHTPQSFLPLQELYLHPDIRALGAQQPAEDQQPDFRPRQGPEAEAALPDFSIDALMGSNLGGGLGGARAKPGATSVHARRGTGLSGTGMFISSKTPGMPAKLGKVGPGEPLGAAVSATDDGTAAPTPRAPPPGWQRPSKLVALAVGEVADLQRRGTPSVVTPGNALLTSPRTVAGGELGSPRGVSPTAAASDMASVALGAPVGSAAASVATAAVSSVPGLQGATATSSAASRLQQVTLGPGSAAASAGPGTAGEAAADLSLHPDRKRQRDGGYDDVAMGSAGGPDGAIRPGHAEQPADMETL